MTLALAEQLESRLGGDVLARLTEEIGRVECELEQQIESPVALVREASRHTLSAGGKRLRPALVTLSAEACARPFDPDRTRRLGAGMEMIHMATLMHDDVIDHAAVRRGIETTAARFGNTAGILTGDVLLSKAMAILAEDGDLEIIRNVARAVVELAEGEVQELEVRGRIDLPEKEHFAILQRKTATFISSCCQVGGLAADARPDEIDALGAYGAAIGMAFQIADDGLDFGDPEVTGKPSGTDFTEGCATLPLILAMRRIDDAGQDRLKTLFGQPIDGSDWDEVRRLVEGSGARDEAETCARQFALEAVAALEALPETPARSLLAAVADFVVGRTA